MYLFFRNRGIKKIEIEKLSQTACVPVEMKFKSAIREFLDMTDLEIDLAMGRVPTEYRKSYFENVKKIAELLDKDKNIKNGEVKPYYENSSGKLRHCSAHRKR